MRKILLTGSISLLMLGAFACSSSNSDPPPPDAGDAQSDAQPPPDGGTDGTIPDGTAPDGGQDADAAADADASGDADANSDADAGLDCKAIIAKMMSAATEPPNKWLGLDFAKGGAIDGGLGSGGLTIDEAGILPCATSVEPTAVDGGVPSQPGLRTATFDGAGGTISVAFNVESRVIALATLQTPATSTLTFHSRAGGSFEDAGTSTYVIRLGTAGDAGADGGGGGSITKNGKDFPADWKSVIDGNGVHHASAWVNEIYDGLMATFEPNAPKVDDCLTTPTTRSNGVEHGASCLVLNQPDQALIGVRPLGTYIGFVQDTNRVTSTYQFWPGGNPSCATPHAVLEIVDTAPIFAGGNRNAALGPVWQGGSIGMLSPAEPIANAAGLLATEANTIAGCSAVPLPARDPGYAAEQWGAHGEIELEYNVTSGVAYKVFAKQGYKGELDVSSSLDDGGTTDYVIAPGTLTKSGSPMTLDWSDAGGSLTAAITDISNGWLANYCDAVDTDCAKAGNCVVTPNDGNGHSTFTLQASPDVAASCGDPHPITFVFPQGGSVPSEIYVTNPAGK